MNTMMTLSIRPRLMDLATDFLLSDDRRKRKLLSWVKSILPWVGDDVVDFTDCWQDGIVFCSLIEAINPGACPRFGQLKAHHRVPNCRLGLQLAMQYLQVTQLPLCPEEMAIADDRTEVKICHLVQLLKWKYQKQGSKPTVFSIFSVDSPLPCKCQARGTGIRAGIVGRRAKFNILAETTTRLDLDIEIRGPNNEYNKEKIVSVDTGSPLPYRNQQLTTTVAVSEEDSKSKIIDDGAGNSFLRQKSTEEDTGRIVIPFDYQCVGEGRFLVTYIPRNAGSHYITVLSGGVHIPGSPFEVKVSDWVSSWNLMPKSRAVPIEMLHSTEEKQLDTSILPKDAKAKINCQLSQVAHMSQQLTRMKRRVLRKVIKANGEEIICDIIPALTRQMSTDQLLVEEDKQQLEGAEQTDNEPGPSSFKSLQTGTFSDHDNDGNDNIHPITEAVTGDGLQTWMLETKVMNQPIPPLIVITPDDECDDSDDDTAFDVYSRGDNDPRVLDYTKDDLKNSDDPDSLERVLLLKEKQVFPSPTRRFSMGSSQWKTIHSSLDGIMITNGTEIRKKPSFSFYSTASSASGCSKTGGTLPTLQDTGHALEKLISHKKEYIPPANTNKIRSVSVDDASLQEGSHFGNENMKPVALGVLESIASPQEIRFSFSVGENSVAGSQKNASPCTRIGALNSLKSKCRESLPDFSLLQISPSKEGCGESGLHDITTHDQVDTHIVKSGDPTDNELWSSLQPSSDHSFEVSDSSVCPVGNLIDKTYSRNQTHHSQRVSSQNSTDTGIWSLHCTTDQSIEVEVNDSSLSPISNCSDMICIRNRSDQIDNSRILYPEKPTDTELSSPQCSTLQSIEMNGSRLGIVGTYNDEMDHSELENRHCCVVEKASDIVLLQNQTDVKEIVHDLDFNNTHEDTIHKNRVSCDVSWASNISSWVNTEHWPVLCMSSSCDMHDVNYEPDIKSLYKNKNCKGKLKKSWSDPYKAGNLDGKPDRRVLPVKISTNSTVDLHKPELELFCEISEACSNPGTGYKELDRNQYKIEILNSDGFSRPYFCFKDSLHCNDNTRTHVSVESKLATEIQNVIKGEQGLRNGRGGDTVPMRASSGGVCSNSNKQNISDVDTMSVFGGCSEHSHSNEATGEEMYSDEDEILHIVIEPKRTTSHNEDTDKQESRVYTTADMQTNDNLLNNFENHDKCMSVLKHTSPDLCNETGGQMTRGQMEEINGVSPFSDLSKISGNSDWSDTDDAARRFSESQKSKYTTGRYFLKGDWSPQFVEHNYQGGIRSRRRSSTRSASSLSPSNCSQRNKYNTPSLVDGGDTDNHRIKSSLENGRRVSDHIKVRDGNENPVKVHFLDNNANGQSEETAGTDLQKKIDNDHKETSNHCLSGNSDQYWSNTTVETTEPSDCKPYLKRRRKPVYIQEHSFDNSEGKDGLTNTAKWQHTQDIDVMKPCIISRPNQKNTAEFISHRMPAFVSKMELLSPDLSDCLPVDNWSSLSNSWVDDMYEHSRYFSGGNGNWYENSNPPYNPYKTPRSYLESFAERTLTPTKYREKKQVNRCVQNIQDKDESNRADFRFYSKQYGHQRECHGIAGHVGFVIGSGSTPVLLTCGDRFLTPTKYRRQTGHRDNSEHNPQMEIPCQLQSKGSDFPARRPVSEEAHEFFFAGMKNTTQAQGQGQALRQNTHGRLNTSFDLRQTNSSQEVSRIPIAEPLGNCIHKYSEMRRGFCDDYITEREHEELHDAHVRQPCLSDLCLNLSQERIEDNKVRRTGYQMAEMRQTIDATEESRKRISNHVRDSKNTYNHLESRFQFSNSEALHCSSESSLGDNFHQTYRGQQKNPRQDSLYYSQTSLENPVLHPLEGYYKNLSETSLDSSHMCKFQNLPQLQTPNCQHGECLMHRHDQLHQQLQNETSSHRSPLAIQQPIPDLLNVEKLEYPPLDYLQQEGIQQEHRDLQEVQQREQTTEWQEDLSESILGYTKDRHRFGVRRQSTVETMDSGITEDSSLYTQLSYTETPSNCDLPGFNDEDIHMSLFLSLS